MNLQFIRQRLNRHTAFTFRLSDGSRVPVAHPDFVAIAPWEVIVIDAKSKDITRIDPIHVVAIEEAGRKTGTQTRKRKP